MTNTRHNTMKDDANLGSVLAAGRSKYHGQQQRYGNVDNARVMASRTAET